MTRNQVLNVVGEQDVMQSLQLSGLEEFQVYSIEIRACTSIGCSSNAANISTLTLSAGKLWSHSSTSTGHIVRVEMALIQFTCYTQQFVTNQSTLCHSLLGLVPFAQPLCSDCRSDFLQF